MKKNTKYTEDFIENLLYQVDNKIALISNKDYKNNIYNLGLCENLQLGSELIQIREILSKILKCHSCYCPEDAENIVLLTLNKLNN